MDTDRIEPGDPATRQVDGNQPTAFETASVVGGLIIFLFLLYEMLVPAEGDRFLGPPLTAAAGAILLWPVRKQRTVRALLLSGFFLLFVWFLDRLSGILTPFVVVYLFAFLFDPLVTLLNEKYRIPRWVSSLGVTFLILGLVVFFVLMLVPNIFGQLEELAVRIITSLGYLREWLATTTFLDDLEESGLIDKEAFIAQITQSAQEQLTRLTTGIPNAVQELTGYIGSLLGLLTMATILPVVLYYTLKDYPYIKRRLVELFPTFGGKRDYLVHAGGVVGNYLRGQITISAIAALNVSVALFIFNVPFALLIGLLAGVLNIVPNLGALLTNIIGILIALIFGGFLDALIVFLVLIGQGLLEGSVLTPKILSSHVGLHPVLIIISLFVFGYFLGILGFLIAVPTTALVMTFYKAFREQLTIELAPRKGFPATPRRFRPQLYPDRIDFGDSTAVTPPEEKKTTNDPDTPP